MYKHVINSFRLHLLYCKWSLKHHIHNIYTKIQFNLYSYNDPNQDSHLYKDYINLHIYQYQMSYQNFKSIVYIIFSPERRENFGDMVYLIVSS